MEVLQVTLYTSAALQAGIEMFYTSASCKEEDIIEAPQEQGDATQGHLPLALHIQHKEDRR